MEHLDIAADALQAFAQYAEMIEQATGEKNIPTLHLYSDGSGRVHDTVAEIVYFHFRDIGQLLDECVKRFNVRKRRSL